MSSPVEYLATKVRVFKQREKRQTLRITVYMQERKIRETIESIVDIINPPFRIRIGFKSLSYECFYYFKMHGS